MTKKIVLVLFPPIINSFNFHSRENKYFIGVEELKKNFLQKNTVEVLEKKNLLELVDIDYSNEISEIIRQRDENTLILVNYPCAKKHFKSLVKELSQFGQKVTNIIL